MTTTELALWESALQSGSARHIAGTAEKLAVERAEIPSDFHFTICDKFWTPLGVVGGDLIDGSGTDPRNDVPNAVLKLKGTSELVGPIMACDKTMVGLIIETAGLRFAHYVKTYDYEMAGSPAWTMTANCPGIWDILNYLQIWPQWYMPIQAQPVSHAIFAGPLCTVIENMITECALRIQTGLNEFINNLGSGNLDLRAWFGTLLLTPNLLEMLKTPLYVVRTNPFLDTSPLVVKTVRMESCATVIREITKPYGVSVNVDLWLPGDPQPDQWANLIQPTYVVTVKDRSQIEGPTKTVLDSVIRTVVDLGGSLGDLFRPVIQQVESMPGVYEAPILGVNFVEPYAILIAPEPGERGSVVSAKISGHTPLGWRHIIGGKSPKWLNDLINSTLQWAIDAIIIVIGFSGIPSTLLDGFLNNAFLAFQLIDLYDRRAQMGPYHPAVETFTATESAPYNVETWFAFINKIWDTRGYVSAQAVFRNGEVLTLGRDVFRGSLVSVVYHGRTKMLTDYIENVLWRLDAKTRDVLLQIGDGQAEESPLAKHQRLITGAFEAINVATLAPQ